MDVASTVREALGRGDVLTAYDEIRRGREAGEEDLRYLEVLTLARLGDAEQASRLYDQYDISLIGGADALSLKARLLKDQAFASGLRPNPELLLQACGLYAAAYRATRSTYPAINAATLAMIAGRGELAALLARAVVKAAATSSARDYFSLATLAEAHVVLNDIESARTLLDEAIGAPQSDTGARSTTVLQLQRLMNAAVDPAAIASLLDLIRPANVAMFCGNIFVPDDKVEADLAAAVAEVISRENVGYGYGALAAGSDILIAEQLLEAGAELHVVLPFAEADFVEQSVAPAGVEWLRRFETCKARATSVTLASHMSYVGDGAQFAYGSKVTMGLARLRARHLYNEALQIAILERTPAATLSSADINIWRSLGGKSFVIGADELRRPIMPPPPPGALRVQRRDCGLMFTDFPGFSQLDERVQPIFWESVMMRGIRILRSFADKVLQTNTWGDALFAVFPDASTAAAAALDLAEQFGQADCAALGVPEGTSMRIALHYGSIYAGHDPGSGHAAYFGTEISLAARIEPVTPPGTVYVTEPFAAVLEIEADPRFSCNYVGRLALAKNYGVFPLYRLSRRPGHEPNREHVSTDGVGRIVAPPPSNDAARDPP